MTREGRLTRRAIEWIDPGGNPAGVVYGTITIGALLAAESGRRETYAEAVGSAVLVVLLYWLAHSYSDVLGERLATKERLSAAVLWRAFVHDWAIVRGASVPVAALLLTWAAGAGEEAAVEVAVWASVASIFMFELLAGLHAHATRRELLLESCVGGALGLAIVLLKLILH